MRGSRVAHHKQSLPSDGKKSSKAQKKPLSSTLKKDDYPILYAIFLILSAIGRPLYLVITGLIVFIFAVIWHIGSIVLRTLKILNTLPGQITDLAQKEFKKVNLSKFTLKTKKKKSRQKKVKSKSFGIPTLKRPTISFPKLALHVSFPSPPSIKKRYKLSFLLLLFISAAWLSFWIFLLRDLPKPGSLITRNQEVSTKIYDRNGNLLYKIYKNKNRTLVKLEDIPPALREATVSIEDEDFYSHPGFSVRGITRAIYNNLTHGELTGGSTITQQLVKQALLSPEKTLLRKVKEIILAIQVEMAFSKDQILEMYLNEVSYGGSSYGAEEASETYFGKPVHDLDLAESALLAGLTQRPTAYSPFGTNPDLALSRQHEVLEKMYQQGYINQTQLEEAENEKLVFAKPSTDIQAPHFVMYIKQLLAEKYGDDMVEEGGLEVTTSLDLTVQNMTQTVVHDEVAKIKRLNINNGSALVTNPQTGEVLAMVGSQDYFDQKNDGNVNVTISQRQPGSSIKPLNYSYAIENGIFNSSSTISDSPITYRIPGAPPYSPHNYDGAFHGNVTIRSALARSLNVPAVKVLASYGVPKFVEHAKKLGITTWNDPSRYGLSITLGAAEVKMTDMAVAYSSFANYGKRVDLKPILKVVDYKGNVLQDNSCSPINTVEKPKEDSLITKVVHIFIPSAYAEEAPVRDCGKQVLSAQTAFIITNILSDNAARTPTFGPHSQLVVDNHPEIAVKTGTTQSMRDNWTIGYNQQYMVLTWVGNNNNQAMSFVASGVTGASPIWHKIMANLVANKPSIAWQQPNGLVHTGVCIGSAANQDYFLPGHEPKNFCAPPSPAPNPDGSIQNPQQPTQGQVL